MAIAYLIFTLFIGVILCIIWSTKDWVNTMIRVMFVLWTIWTMSMLAGHLDPLIRSGALSL
jgi:predicted ABC-type exoprotein transport system permease subunit